MWIASACVCIVVFASFTFIQSHTSFLFLYTKKESKVLNTLNSNIAFVTFLVYHVSDEMSRAMRAFLLLYLFFRYIKLNSAFGQPWKAFASMFCTWSDILTDFKFSQFAKV